MRDFFHGRIISVAIVLAVLVGCTPGSSDGEGVAPANSSSQVFRWKMITTWPKNLPGLGVGGLLGILLIPFLTAQEYGGVGYGDSNFSDLMTTQVIGAISVGVYTLVGSIILLLIVRAIFGLRVPDDSQEEGLDVAEHGQSGYKL